MRYSATSKASLPVALRVVPPVEHVAAGWFGFPVVVHRWWGARSFAGDGDRWAGGVAVAGAAGFAEGPGDRRYCCYCSDRHPAGSDCDRLWAGVVDPQPGPQVDGEFAAVRTSADCGVRNGEQCKGLLSQ